MIHRAQKSNDAGWREWALALLLVIMAGLGTTGLAQFGGDAIADLTATPSTGKAPLEAVFEIEVGPPSSPDCPADSYMLDFGDGSEPARGSSNGPFMVPHSYTNLGIFKAKLSFTTSINVGIASVNCQSDDAMAELNISVLSAEPLRFIGSDGNWFDPKNWDQGRVPGEDDGVLLDGEQMVIIDPEKDPTAAGAGKATFKEFTLKDESIVELRPGTTLQVSNLAVLDSATFFARSSVVTGETLTLNGNGAAGCDICAQNPDACAGGFGGGGTYLNPAYMHFEGIKGEATMMTFFLGGTIAASPDGTGPGHYPVLAGDDIMLDDVCLNIQTIYDFLPSVGDKFMIMEATGAKELTGTLILANADGTTRKLEDGDTVARFGDVILVIHFEPKAVVLEARPAPAPLRFVGTDGDWFNPANWSDGRVPGQFDDVMIDRDSLVIIDPAKDPNAALPSGISKVGAGTLELADNARLETEPGVILNFNNMLFEDNSGFFFRSAELHGTYFDPHGGGHSGCTYCSLNPSIVDVDTFEYKGGKLTFFLGGTEPAARGAVGQGHYANVRAETIMLRDTVLGVDTIYDFVPKVGDEFMILEASESLTGTFYKQNADGSLAELKDGDVVATIGDIELVYQTQIKVAKLTCRKSGGGGDF